MLGDLDKDCKTLEAESWHEWQRDLCLGFPLFEKYVEILMVQMRQCHSSGIYKQARGNQINTALSSFMEHDAVVFKTQHSPLTCHLMSAQVCTPTPLGCICPQNFVVWISLQGYPSENIPLFLCIWTIG
jgi:hypothetical protein